MTDPQGFLKVRRASVPKRPIAERLHDYRHVYQPADPDALRRQASRCMDCGVPFCNTGCPLGNLIPDWNDLVYGDRWQAAITRLHLTNNFPEFTGLLCPAPCEASCVLSINDDAVTIKEIELSIVNRAFEEGWIVPRPPLRRTGKRVAVVGSGPAGLAAAQQLNRAGHTVTVLERDDKVGGLLRYGIPDFKLEKWVIDRRVDLLEREGIAFSPKSDVGHAPTVQDLHSQFDAALLAVGALQGRDLLVPGRELGGIHMAMDYLVQQNRRVAGLPIGADAPISAQGKHVVIVGGGDTSADCLGNALREGAASVRVLTHGPRPPDVPSPLSWPDWPFIFRTYPAHEEGGERYWSVAITGFSGIDGKVARLHTVQVERQGDGSLEVITGSEDEIETDLVLLAVGFEGPQRDRLLHDLDIALTESGVIESDACFRTSVPDVFVAGDAKLGASLIVSAIAEGRKAARQIDLRLMGRTLLSA